MPRKHTDVSPADNHHATDFDALEFILRFEGDGDALTNDELAAGFQHLIDSGLVWQLQGTYGRTATALIRAGLCHPRTGGAL